jgi:hypothetical protein
MTSQLPFFLAYIWLIPMFPLITAAAMLFFGRKLKNDVINGLCVGSVFLSFIFSAGAPAALSLPQTIASPSTSSSNGFPPSRSTCSTAASQISSPTGASSSTRFPP